MAYCFAYSNVKPRSFNELVLYKSLAALHYLFTELFVGDEGETEYEFDGSDREEEEAADGEGAPRFVHSDFNTRIMSENFSDKNFYALD